MMTWSRDLPRFVVPCRPLPMKVVFIALLCGVVRIAIAGYEYLVTSRLPSTHSSGAKEPLVFLGELLGKSTSRKPQEWESVLGSAALKTRSSTHLVARRQVSDENTPQPTQLPHRLAPASLGQGDLSDRAGQRAAELALDSDE